MAYEPINIFSHKIDPAGVVRLIRKLAPDVVVAGPDDDWSELVVVTRKKGLFRREQQFVLGHSSDYYDGDDWPMQMFGMSNYFAEFPDAPIKADVMRMIRSFRFSLSVPMDDLSIDSNDSRLDLLFEVCRYLDGAFFTPSSFRDASGRILYDAGGVSDPAAVMPKLPPTEDHPEANAGDEAEEDYPDPEPPRPDRVARRTLALTAVSARATLELDASQDAVDEPELFRQRILDWVSDLDIGDELEPEEWKVLQRPVRGEMNTQDFINAMWRVEGLAVLAWALQLHPIPRYDELVSPPELYNAIGLFDKEAGQELLQSSTLRSTDELDRMGEHILAFHWRLRDFSLRPQPMDFVAFSRKCWFGSFDLSNFQVVNGDLALGGVEISEAEPDEISKAGSTAQERHVAINWLHGYSNVYSETDTST